jgi:hypothetical protein
MEIITRKNVTFLRFHLLYLFNLVCYITQRRSVLEPTANPNHTEASVLCKVRGILRTIFMKLVRDFLPNERLCVYIYTHIYIYIYIYIYTSSRACIRC